MKKLFFALLFLSPGLAHATCSTLSVPSANMQGYPILLGYNPTIYTGSTPGASVLSMDGTCDLNVNVVGGSFTPSGTQAVSGALNAFVDGWNQTEGTTGAAAYTGTGSASEISIEKGIYAALVASLPAGANIIGKVGIDQTTPGTSNNVTVTPQAVTVTWAGGSVTTGGAFQSALATSSSRKGCQIQNTSSAIEFINSSGSPTTSNSNQINPFGTYSCSVTSNLVDQAAIEISGAVAGQTYVVSSW